MVNFFGPQVTQYTRKPDRWLCLFFATFIGLTVLSNAYEVSFAGFTINPERLAALPLLGIVLLYSLHGRSFLFPKGTAILLVSWLVWGLATSLLCDVVAWSIKMWLLLNVAISFYFITILLKLNPYYIFTSWFFRLLAWFFGPFVVLVYLASLFNVSLPSFVGSWLQEGSGGLRIRATLQEANLYGSVLSLFILMMLALKMRRTLLWWSLFLGLHIGLLFSFSRIPWLAYLVAVCVYYLLLLPYRFNVCNTTKICIVLLAFVSITALSGYLVFMEFGKYEIVGRVHSVTTRLVMWELAVDDIYQHPIIGNGVFSLSKLHPSAAVAVGSDTERSVWISNLFLAVLHDTGLVGLGLFCSFLTVVLARAVVAIRTAVLLGGVDLLSLRITAALAATGVSFIVSGMSIPAHCLGFFWVVFALIERASLQVSNSNYLHSLHSERVRP